MKNALWLFALAVIILVIFLPSYTQMQDLKEKNISYTQQIERLTQENKKLSQEKRRLEEDPIYLEKVAREKMGLVKEGEVVYKIIPEQQNKEGR